MEARFLRMILARSPQERLAMAFGMFSTAKALVQAGLLREHGHLSDVELRQLTFERLYGLDYDEATRRKVLRHFAAP